MKRSVLKAPKGDFGKLLYSRRSFVASVYSLLAFQVAITAIVSYFLRQHQKTNEIVQKYLILWVIISFGLIITLALVDMHPLLKLCVLSMFSFTIGLNCIAASKQVSEQVIKAALVATFGIFVGMTTIGLFLLSIGVSLNFLRYVLFAGLLGLLVALLTMIFIPVSNTMHKIVLGFGITLFSVYVAYDTNAMIQPGYGGDAIDASVRLYLDVLNIFTEIWRYGTDVW